MKKICVLLLTILTLLLTSCGEDTTRLAKDEFSKYYNGRNEVVLNYLDNLYFENYILSLSDLIEKSEFNNGLIIKQDKFFFSTSTENSMYDFTLNIYEANLQGTNVKMIFSKDGYKTHPWVYAIDEMFYVEFYSNNAFDLKSKLIDKYTISTRIYENVASGEDCSLSDYFQSNSQSRYSIEVVENISPQEHGEFIITDLENGITNIIDDDYLKDTIYIESMEKFNYSPMRFDISNDKILLTYGIGAGDGWNNAHLIFEYDFNLNKLKYQLLAFPDDLMNVKIIYIG